MKTKKKLKKRIKRLTGLLEAFANAFNTVIDDELCSRNKFVCNASCSGEGTANIVSVFKHPAGTGSYGACSDVGTIGPTPFKDDGGGSGSFISLPTTPCGVIGSTGPTGPTEVREPRLVGMIRNYGCTGWTGPEVLAPTSALGHDINRASVIVKPLVDKILSPTGPIGIGYGEDESSEQKDSWQKYCKDSTIQLLQSKLNKINYHLGPTGSGSMEYETLESSKSNSDLHEFNFKVCFQYLKDLMEDNDPLFNPDMEELLIKLYGSYITYNKYLAFYSFHNSRRNKR